MKKLLINQSIHARFRLFFQTAAGRASFQLPRFRIPRFLPLRIPFPAAVSRHINSVQFPFWISVSVFRFTALRLLRTAGSALGDIPFFALPIAALSLKCTGSRHPQTFRLHRSAGNRKKFPALSRSPIRDFLQILRVFLEMASVTPGRSRKKYRYRFLVLRNASLIISSAVTSQNRSISS